MEQNLSQYKIFYEVAKAGNISKAAKELYISQPAISKAISKLEDSIGIPLFTRSSRGVQLTAEGQETFQKLPRNSISASLPSAKPSASWKTASVSRFSPAAPEACS